MTAAKDARSRWTWRGLARGISITAISGAAGAALGYLVSHERPPLAQGAPAPAASGVQPRPHASDAELAIVAPLREGTDLGGFEVAEIDAIGGDGVLRMVCRRQGAAITLELALAVDGGPPPPAVADRYAVFYSVDKAPPAEGERLALALATILRANSSTPTPPGLAPFKVMSH